MAEPPAAARVAMIVARRFTRASSCLNEWTGVLQVLVPDGVGRPVRQGADGAGRVVSGVLWEGAGSHHEQVRHLPALKVAIHDTGLGIGAHDRAAGIMGGLV